MQRDIQKALELFEKAGELGNRFGFTILGAKYREGTVVPKNDRLAVEFFKKAAEMKCPAAIGFLGLSYHSGRGVEQNDELAIQYLKEAADIGGTLMGNDIRSDALSDLSRLYGISYAPKAITQNNAQQETQNPRGPIVKGFWIGMNIKDAAKLVNEKYTEELEGRYRVGGMALVPEDILERDPEEILLGAALGATADGGDPILCRADDTGRVNYLAFSYSATNRMFKASDMSPEQFAEAFVEAYKLSRMEPFLREQGDRLINGWEYIDEKNGVQILIIKAHGENPLNIPNRKQLVIKHFATVKERGFD